MGDYSSGKPLCTVNVTARALPSLDSFCEALRCGRVLEL